MESHAWFSCLSSVIRLLINWKIETKGTRDSSLAFLGPMVTNYSSMWSHVISLEKRSLRWFTILFWEDRKRDAAFLNQSHLWAHLFLCRHFLVLFILIHNPISYSDDTERIRNERERPWGIKKWLPESVTAHPCFLSLISYFWIIPSYLFMEGWPCTRESNSEFNRESLNFQHSLCLDNVTQRSNRQAQENFAEHHWLHHSFLGYNPMEWPAHLSGLSLHSMAYNVRE